ncbi:MAG: hypothetical protein WAK31_26985 [Chthoniobacterales bacterium]
MPTKKRAKKQPDAASAATAKQVFEPVRSKRRLGRPGKKAQTVPVVEEVKSEMHRILEGQREQLIQLNDDSLQKVNRLRLVDRGCSRSQRWLHRRQADQKRRQLIFTAINRILAGISRKSRREKPSFDPRFIFPIWTAQM